MAIDAGTVITSISPTKGIIEKKGRGNFATQADLLSEKLIMTMINKHFPDDTILSEETKSDISNPLAESHIWIIDPIDGTHNFRYGRNYSAVSIGYAEKGEVKLAAIYDIFRGDLYWSEKESGSYKNNEQLSISTKGRSASGRSNKNSLDDITLITDNSYNPEDTRKILNQIAKLEPVPFIIMNGSAALEFCEIASGKADLFYHTTLEPWDNAAGFLMVREAGGMVKNLNGERATFMDKELVAGNEKLIDLLLKQINP